MFSIAEDRAPEILLKVIFPQAKIEVDRDVQGDTIAEIVRFLSKIGDNLADFIRGAKIVRVTYNYFYMAPLMEIVVDGEHRLELCLRGELSSRPALKLCLGPEQRHSIEPVIYLPQLCPEHYIELLTLLLDKLGKLLDSDEERNIESLIEFLKKNINIEYRAVIRFSTRLLEVFSRSDTVCNLYTTHEVEERTKINTMLLNSKYLFVGAYSLSAAAQLLEYLMRHELLSIVGRVIEHDDIVIISLDFTMPDMYAMSIVSPRKGLIVNLLDPDEPRLTVTSVPAGLWGSDEFYFVFTFRRRYISTLETSIFFVGVGKTSEEAEEQLRRAIDIGSKMGLTLLDENDEEAF